MNHAEQKTKKRFVLTMRNQKGQVGIFVALIFQVIFVFFAMLVNVGLVVHHKINLQQSTDLAAYYGAMKQAEIMNVMAHVNFQIRQAWKLMAWRYRVLGTFGIEQEIKSPDPRAIQFPVSWATGLQPKYNPSSKSFTCPPSAGANAAGVTLNDVPFMCMGHNGFHDWISAPVGQTETYCKVDCTSINTMKAFSITEIPPVGTSGIWGNTMGASVQAAITKANSILENVCRSLGPITTQMLALYYGNYIKDTQNRKAFIEMMAKDLGLSEEKMLDLEGKLVLDGVKNTLKNNLTEANRTSMTDSSITAFNSVKSFGGPSLAETMIKEINFKRLLFFMIDCNYDAGSTTTLKSLYDGGTPELDPTILANLPKAIPDPNAIESIKQLFRLNGQEHNTIGFEKNPWIQVYYGVKASAEPKIPFLPLAKIKLNAISFAKPFGGTIGPWYFKTWNSADADNDGRSDWGNRTDINLPRRNMNGLSSTPTLKEARDFFFNYSTYVGDNYANDSTAPDPGNKGGLANVDIVAFYHTLLANKYGVGNSTFSSQKTPDGKMGKFEKPTRWPAYADWYHLARDVGDTEFDPLAVDRQDGGNPKNSYMRDIELSVVAPNQFDVSYYSIDPDFYSNYGDKLKGSIGTIANATGSPTPVLPLDYGYPRINISGIGLDTDFTHKFNVRHQLEVTHKLFKEAIGNIVSLYGNGYSNMRFALDVIASKQSSLLTGWTFLNLTADGYKNFPNADAPGKNSMVFGTCDTALNPWSENYQAPYDLDINLPAIPGNCLTGGRTGYSVKLISSDILREGRLFENLGGAGSDGKIKNPVPDDFFNF